MNINKDAVIDDLKRKLAATEYERDCYKLNYTELSLSAYEQFLIIEFLRGCLKC